MEDCLVVYYSSSGNTRAAAEDIAGYLQCPILELQHVPSETNKRRKVLAFADPDMDPSEEYHSLHTGLVETMASAVRKFLQQTDLSGHELYPVATHGGKPSLKQKRSG